MSNSGIGARVAGEAIGAGAFLPTMATEDFLSCLSRQALEREAAANAVRIEPRVKDTRMRLIQHFAGATWHYPGALFTLTRLEIESGIGLGGHYVRGIGDHSTDADDNEPEDGTETAMEADSCDADEALPDAAD